MKYKVHQAVVIGAGTMGAAIAAHLANAGVRVTLLDIVPGELTPDEIAKGLMLDTPVVRNRIVNAGLERAVRSRPASFYSKALVSRVKTGNLEDDFNVIGEADWVIEAIIENLAIKQNLMKRIDRIRKPETIVSTNTSGIPVASIAEGCSEGFRKHFLGTHFFNPPRYLKLLEVIPTPETLPEVVDFIAFFGEYRLGKGIVLCKDTPNFIANRLAFGTGAFALDYILTHDYSVEEVDSITGPIIGRPKTATFRLIDLVGIDVWEHVGTNLAAAIPHDKHALKYLGSKPANELIRKMIGKGWLGNKTKQGFYKQLKKDGKKAFYPLNLKTLEYHPPAKPRFESIGKAKDAETLKERLEILLAEDDKAARLIQMLIYQELAYASELIPEVADTPKPVDDAMRWGFGHDAGPYEIWDLLGVEKMIEPMKQAGFPPATWVGEMLKAGVDSFYQWDDTRKTGVYNPEKGVYQPIKRPEAMLVLKEEKSKGRVVFQNTGATLIDLGDGVGCVEFNTKMNTIDEDILRMMENALDRTESGEFDGLVIGNDGDNFSVGANLFGVVMAAKSGMWDQLSEMVRQLQELNMRMRYSPQPVVVAPAGMTLGGGAEIMMQASRVVAAGELYTGLVEVGAGVIPAGGGTKEMVRRIVNPPMRTKDVDSFLFLQRVFEQVGMAKVATSAVEAREFGMLGPADRIVINRGHLIAEAKKEVLHMLETGYQPPAPEQVYASGRDVLAGLRVGLHMFKEGGFITNYEAHIGEKLIYVMCGGEISQGTWMDEQYFLDLEREAFLSLCGEEKTQERMWHILQTGKPLRN